MSQSVLYEVRFTPRATRDFRTLGQAVQQRLAPRIDALADEPRPRGVEKLSNEDDLYRIRAGDYRVIYQVQDHVLTVLVVRVAHRREVYKKR